MPKHAASDKIIYHKTFREKIEILLYSYDKCLLLHIKLCLFSERNELSSEHSEFNPQ